MTAPKITLGKRSDPPSHSGWQGYSDRVPVFLDGERIGDLTGSGHNKARLNYSFDGEASVAKHYPKFALPTGIKAAREALERAVAKALSSHKRETN